MLQAKKIASSFNLILKTLVFFEIVVRKLFLIYFGDIFPLHFEFPQINQKVNSWNVLKCWWDYALLFCCWRREFWRVNGQGDGYGYLRANVDYFYFAAKFVASFVTWFQIFFFGQNWKSLKRTNWHQFQGTKKENCSGKEKNKVLVSNSICPKGG